MITLSRGVLPTVKYQGIFAHFHINDFFDLFKCRIPDLKPEFRIFS